MTDQKRHEDMNRGHKNPGNQDRDRRNTAQNNPEPEEGERFSKDRVNRDRSAFESQNQGQGPQHVGDQSRTR
jgi:hypothetical protein